MNNNNYFYDLSDELLEIIYGEEHKIKMKNVLDDVLEQEIDVAIYDNNCKFVKWITFSLIEYENRRERFMKVGHIAWEGKE